MNTTLTFKCTNQNSNGSMQLKIFDNKQLVYSGQDFDEGALTIAVPVSWPTTVTVLLSNKTGNDTIMDENNTVIRDKGIFLEQLLVNNFPIETKVMESLLECTKQNSKEITNDVYWGFNGRVTIKLTEPNPTRWFLKLNNTFQLNRLKWK